MRRQNFKCALTGFQLTPTSASLDHVVPLSLGGTHDIENCQVVRADVNRAKGTLTNEQFIAMCRAVAAKADGIESDELEDDMPLFVKETKRKIFNG